jgi:microcystin-dependent protein
LNFATALDSSRQLELKANAFGELWSSSDFDPDVLTAELNKIFIYNKTASEILNNSDIYFNYNEKYDQSSKTSGKFNVGFKLFKAGGEQSNEHSSKGDMDETNQNIVSLKDIKNSLAKQSIETEWSGKKIEPKSFKVYKLTDITDKLQVAVMSKQLYAEKANNATLLTISTMNMPPAILSPNQSSTSVRSSFVLTGEIRLYSGQGHPSSPWLLCNGTAISRVDYQRLFLVIGESYGAGDGVFTFTLPDFRGRVPIGVDDLELRAGKQATRVGLSGGQATHQLEIEHLPPHEHASGTISLSTSGYHSHSISDPGHDHGGQTGSGIYGRGRFELSGTRGGANEHGTHTHPIARDTTHIRINDGGGHTHQIAGETASVGSGQQFSLMQPFQAVNYIIYSD